MKKLIFSGETDIQIQGSKVLRFLELKENYALYEVIGFGNNVIIRDYRLAGLEAINNLHRTHDMLAFAPQFSVPGSAEIWEAHETSLTIELRDSEVSTIPTMMLWIVVGIGNEIPVYEYHYQNILPIDETHYAAVLLYRRPQRNFFRLAEVERLVDSPLVSN